MAYAYWKSGKRNDNAVFDLYFRKNPFDGEFTIFAGLDECLRYLENFRYSDSDVEYLKQTLPDGIENEFFDYLKKLTAKEVILYALPEGTVAFPRYPKNLYPNIILNIFSLIFAMFNVYFQSADYKSRRAIDNCSIAGNNTADIGELCQVNGLRVKPNQQ